MDSLVVKLQVAYQPVNAFHNNWVVLSMRITTTIIINGENAALHWITKKLIDWVNRSTD
jgi:hypothetical protein